MLMRAVTRVTAAGALLFLAGAVLAADAERGRQIAASGNGKGAVACASCHGLDGAGNAPAGFPRLAGLDAAYMSKQIADFTSGKRSNPIMTPIAAALSADESAAVAAYFAQLQARTEGQRSAVSPEALERGRQLAQVGDWNNGLPACVSCHGPGGKGVGESFPAIAGQHASYISGQIQAWKEGNRHNDPVDLMKVVANKLSESDTAAVAAYFAGLEQR